MNARVLVTASGSIVAQDIIKSLKLASKTGRVKYNIIAADVSPLAAGFYRCYAGVLVPPASSRDYVDAIVKICEKMSAQQCSVALTMSSWRLHAQRRGWKNWRQAADRLFRIVGCCKGQVEYLRVLQSK
jgi:hypothetical protein